VAFGRGGTAPTVTDAHVALGNIHAAQLGEVRIDAAAAVNVVAALADRLGVTVERVSAAIIASADAAMARALRRLSIERGIDPRHCVLIAFGGGGPLHACGLADGLGMTRVLVPPHAGVLSALGLALAPDRRVSLASVMREASTLDAGARRELCAALDDHDGAVGGRGALVARARYRGQGHELDVAWEEDVDGVELARRFADVHDQRYGFRLDRPVDLVSARHTRTSEARTVELRRRGASSWEAAARHDDGGAFEATVEGRATIVLADSTLLVPAGWTARTLDIGGWMVERTA
jgi:N-methylhydantoinase A